VKSRSRLNVECVGWDWNCNNHEKYIEIKPASPSARTRFPANNSFGTKTKNIYFPWPLWVRREKEKTNIKRHGRVLRPGNEANTGENVKEIVSRIPTSSVTYRSDNSEHFRQRYTFRVAREQFPETVRILYARTRNAIVYNQSGVERFRFRFFFCRSRYFFMVCCFLYKIQNRNRFRR